MYSARAHTHACTHTPTYTHAHMAHIPSHFKSCCSLTFIFITTKKCIIIIGPYEIRFISKFSFFISIFLYSVLMVKLNCIHLKACLINRVFHYFLDSISMVPLHFNNQKDQYIYIYIFFFSSTKSIQVNIISGKYSFKKCFLITIVLLD